MCAYERLLGLLYAAVCTLRMHTRVIERLSCDIGQAVVGRWSVECEIAWWWIDLLVGLVSM